MAACQQSDEMLSRHTSHDSGRSSTFDSFQLDEAGITVAEDAGVGGTIVPLDSGSPPVGAETVKESKHITFTRREDSGLGNEDFYTLTGSQHQPAADDAAAEVSGVDKYKETSGANDTYGSGSSKSDRSSSPVEEVDFETPETIAIKNFYTELSGRIAVQLLEVSAELYSKSLIADVVHKQVLESNSECSQAKAQKVLMAVRIEVMSTPGKLEVFNQVLEKCGLEDIAERMRASYIETRQSPIGDSDCEFVRSRPSSVLYRYKASLSNHEIGKNLKRKSSQPTGMSLRSRLRKSNQSRSADSDGYPDKEEEELDQKMMWKQVLEANSEVIELKELIRKQEKKIKEQKKKITRIENEKEQLLVKMKNLEVRNSILFLRQHSQISAQTVSAFSEGESDFPDCPPDIWGGCQCCFRAGNVLCKESIV